MIPLRNGTVYYNSDKAAVKLTALKKLIMGNLLYIIAVVLVIAWLIGFIGYSAGGMIHILLVIAVVVILIRIIQGRKPL